jgi:hypothetical protein
VFAAAASAAPESRLVWHAASGRLHDLRVASQGFQTPESKDASLGRPPEQSAAVVRPTD